MSGQKIIDGLNDAIEGRCTTRVIQVKPDLVERLRVWPAAYGEDAMSSTYVGQLTKSAADEIERLRALLRMSKYTGRAPRSP